MSIPLVLLHKIAQVIVLMFKRDAPVIEQAAAAAAIGAAESDPKVQAIQSGAAAMISAAHAFTDAMNAANAAQTKP